MVQPAPQPATGPETAGPGVIKPVDEIKILLKYSDQCMFLQPMLSARIINSIFDFWICIPTNNMLMPKLTTTKEQKQASLPEII